MRKPGGWHWRRLLDSPHRLGFFLAMVVLGASALWWAAVQLARSGALPPTPLAVSPSLVHAAVMTFGFFPLFFCGSVCAGGPPWLHVRAGLMCAWAVRYGSSYGRPSAAPRQR